MDICEKASLGVCSSLLRLFRGQKLLGQLEQLLHNGSELLLALEDLDQLLCCRLVTQAVPPHVEQLVHLQYTQSESVTPRILADKPDNCYINHVMMAK